MRIIDWLLIITVAACVVANFIPHTYPTHEGWIEVGLPFVWFELDPIVFSDVLTVGWGPPSYRGGILLLGLVSDIAFVVVVTYLLRSTFKRLNSPTAAKD